MNTYGLLGDVRGPPTQIPTQNNSFAKLACALQCCSNLAISKNTATEEGAKSGSLIGFEHLLKSAKKSQKSQLLLKFVGRI